MGSSKTLVRSVHEARLVRERSASHSSKCYDRESHKQLWYTRDYMLVLLIQIGRICIGICQPSSTGLNPLLNFPTSLSMPASHSTDFEGARASCSRCLSEPRTGAYQRSRTGDTPPKNLWPAREFCAKPIFLLTNDSKGDLPVFEMTLNNRGKRAVSNEVTVRSVSKKSSCDRTTFEVTSR